MKYIYTLQEDGRLAYFDVYRNEPVNPNQTLIPIVQGLYNPTFDKERQVWVNGELVEDEEVKQKTEEELLAEQVEATKNKVITEFELRKLLAEQQRNNMKMMMMMLKK